MTQPDDLDAALAAQSNPDAAARLSLRARFVNAEFARRRGIVTGLAPDFRGQLVWRPLMLDAPGFATRGLEGL